MKQSTLPKITKQDKIKYKDWWSALSDNWKKAINQAAFQKGEITDDLTIEEIHDLFHNSVALRFAGPMAAYPNLTFEIGDLEGLKEIKSLKILAVMNSNITSLKPIANLTNLESLYVLDNALKTLTGIEKLSNLKELNFQNNRVKSIEPLKKLTNLHTVSAVNNEIKSLKGLTEKHSKNLRNFYVLPNDKLPQKEIIRLENKVGIRCLRG
ncbi:MAG: leucine-rich repeat domain-containing protein [Saprospiraceae bacterium]